MLLALILVIGMVPTIALAEEGKENTEEIIPLELSQYVEKVQFMPVKGVPLKIEENKKELIVNPHYNYTEGDGSLNDNPIKQINILLKKEFVYGDNNTDNIVLDAGNKW